VPLGDLKSGNREKNTMGVLVCYDEFTYDVINDYYLDYLVQTKCIIGYDKSGEWVKTEKLPPVPLESLKHNGKSAPES
jgi:hypothetical protein